MPGDNDNYCEQGETGVLRNRMIAVEAKNNALEQEKEDLQNTITAIQNTKPEPGETGTNKLIVSQPRLAVSISK